MKKNVCVFFVLYIFPHTHTHTDTHTHTLSLSPLPTKYRMIVEDPFREVIDK
jgi:hypothetical protein